MPRQRSTPRIYRWSRPVMAGVATLGAVVTAYLTHSKLTGSQVACPVEGCNIVLSSPYANLFGLPLALFGFLAYVAMIGFAIAPLLISAPDKKLLREEVERWTGFLLFWGGTAMVVFSAYLMLLLAFAIKAVCLYCIVSALCSVTLFVLSVVGRDWEDIGQLILGGLIAFTVMGVVSFGMFTFTTPQLAQAYRGEQQSTGEQQSSEFAVTPTSGEAEIALAKHLAESGAKFYGAFWCPHCYKQKQVFGQAAMAYVPYVECSEPDRRTQTPVCQAQKIEGYPTWEINGQRSTGEKSLEDLANLSGYQGPRNFQNHLPSE